MAHSHRSTLKTKHKPFKSKHASKSAIKARNKGKVEKGAGAGKAPHVMSKQERRNLANQIKANKNFEVTENKKVFDGRYGAPKVVAVIPLTEDVDCQEVVHKLNQSVGHDKEATFGPNGFGTSTVTIERFKQKIKYFIPRRDFFAVLDAAKVADIVVFVLSAVTEVDKAGETCIRAIESQGVSTVVPVIAHLDEAGQSKKQTDAVRTSLFSYFSHFFPSTEKIYSLDVASEAQNAARFLCQKFPKGVLWRDERPYMLADDVAWDKDSQTVAIRGVVRGRGLNADRLVHIPGYGDFQIHAVQADGRGPLTPTANDGMETDDQILTRPSEGQDSLEDLAPEPLEDDEMMDDEQDNEEVAEERTGVMMDGEQPTLRRFADASDDEDDTGVPKHVPKGMSTYMAHWIVDDEDEEGEDGSDEEGSDNEMEADGETTMAAAATDDAMSEFPETDNQTEAFVELSAEEEERQLKEFRARAKEDLDFPDEIEIPPNVSAKERLHRYRGVKSLRTCTWDANERDARRPEEWQRLTRIGNYRATRNRVLKEALTTGGQVPVGTPVIVYVRAPETVASFYDREQPLIMYGLLRHEHQLAVVNMSINPNTEYTEPVASKADLVVQCGPRRLRIHPLFSQAGSNAANGVYKYDRFLQPGRAATATVIAPLTFGSVPVVYFARDADGALDMVGSGSVLDADKNRVLAKRVVLTGHPLKIHKKLVTIRYMFFNPEDVQWFKAVPLFTKHGRTGYIKESLGTHGYFKATFDGRIDSQDTVGMALYKRVWPRLSFPCDF